jgi:undecaprenyl-diphosphatase
VTLAYAALLGVVQGLTEFLPVSSSAHLILARSLLGWDAAVFGLAFDVACHVGTLLAVVLFFRRDLLEMMAAAPHLFGPSPGARRARLVVAGTLPVVVVGITLADVIERSLRTPAVSAAMLAVGALGLLAAERLGPRRRGDNDIHLGDALALGVAQATALVPGVSRSGITMTVGMFAGLRRDAAARFSFLLGVPAILAAAAKEGLDLLDLGVGRDEAALFAVGMTTSAIVGYLTIKYFLRYLVRHRLDIFAYYRLALASAVLVWFLAR